LTAVGAWVPSAGSSAAGAGVSSGIIVVSRGTMAGSSGCVEDKSRRTTLA